MHGLAAYWGVAHNFVGFLEEGIELLGGVIWFWDWICRKRLSEDR